MPSRLAAGFEPVRRENVEMTMPRLASALTAWASGIAILILVVFIVGPSAALIGVLAIAGFLILLRYPVVGIYLLVALLPFNGLLSQVMEGTTIASAYGASKDVLLFALLGIAVVSGKIRRVPRSIGVLVLLTVGVALISGLFTPTFGQATYGWRNDFEPLLLLLIVPAVVEPEALRRLLGFIVLIGQIAALVAIYTWNAGLEWLYELNILPVAADEVFPSAMFSSGSVVPRAFSPYVAPNEMAVVMCVGLAVIWLRRDSRTWVRILLSIAPSVALLLSESRSGIIGAIVVICVLAARAIHQRSPLLTGAFVTVASAGVLTGVLLYINNQLGDSGDPSVGGHSVSLLAGIQHLAQNPLGIGLGTVGPRAEQFGEAYLVESFWLLLGLEAGIIVLALYLALLLRLFVLSLKARGALPFMGAAALSGTVMSQLVLPTFQEGAVSFTVWIVVGLALVAIRSEEDAPPPVRIVSPARRVPMPARHGMSRTAVQPRSASAIRVHFRGGEH
jgi:putative inorganic carbon (HCO3(-)) transporter